MYYNVHKNIIICKTYKTASTTLYKLLENCKDNSILIRDHLSIKTIRKRYNIQKENVTCIVGIRNPWDMVSSYYHYCVDGEEEGVPSNESFEFFIRNRKRLWCRNTNNWDFSEIDDVVVFEDLENEINRIGNAYDIDCMNNPKIPHIGKSSNTNFKENYNEELKDIVFREYENYIKFLNNKFGIQYEF